MKVVNSREDKNVLLIDDCEDYLRLINLLIKKEGYEVSSVDSAIKGLATIENQPTNLVILDLKIPDTSELRIIQSFKSKCRALNIPIVLLTDNLDLKENFHDVDEICHKPLNVEILLKKVKYLIES